MALLLRNTRPYLLPLLRSSRPAIALASRAYSSGSDEVSSRSPVGLGFRNGASGQGRLDEGITGATPTTAPHGDTDRTTSGRHGGLVEGNAEYGLVGGEVEMSRDIVVTFLGTSSGGGPTKTRNCSSLVADVLGDGSLWSAYYPSNWFMFHSGPPPTTNRLSERG